MEAEIYLSQTIDDSRICDRLEMPTNASNLDHFGVLVDGKKRFSGRPTSDAIGVVANTGNL